MCPRNHFSQLGSAGCTPFPSGDVQIDTVITVPGDLVAVVTGYAIVPDVPVWIMMNSSTPPQLRREAVLRVHSSTGVIHNVEVIADPIAVTVGSVGYFVLGIFRHHRSDTIYNITMIGVAGSSRWLRIYSGPLSQALGASLNELGQTRGRLRIPRLSVSDDSGNITADFLERHAEFLPELNIDRVSIATDSAVDWTNLTETDVIRVRNCTYTTRLQYFSQFEGPAPRASEMNFPVMYSTRHPYGLFLYVNRTVLPGARHLVLDQWETGSTANMYITTLNVDVKAVVVLIRSIDAITGTPLPVSVTSVHETFTFVSAENDTTVVFTITGPPGADDRLVLGIL